jgi:hypothetical protein
LAAGGQHAASPQLSSVSYRKDFSSYWIPLIFRRFPSFLKHFPLFLRGFPPSFQKKDCIITGVLRLSDDELAEWYGNMLLHRSQDALAGGLPSASYWKDFLTGSDRLEEAGRRQISFLR